MSVIVNHLSNTHGVEEHAVWSGGVLFIRGSHQSLHKPWCALLIGHVGKTLCHARRLTCPFLEIPALCPPELLYTVGNSYWLLALGSLMPNFLGKSYSRKKIGRSDGFAGMLLFSLESGNSYVCISSQKRPPNQARMDPWPSER